jgi:hypothetical protein
VQHLMGGGAWSPDGRTFAYSANARTPTDSEVWLQSAEGGEPRPIFGEGRLAAPARWSPDGSKLLAVDFRSNTDQSIFVLHVDSDEATEITPHEGEVKFLPGPWLADGSGFFLLTDEGREFTGLALLTSPVARLGETPERDRGAVRLGRRAPARVGRERRGLGTSEGTRPRERRRPARAAAPSRHDVAARRATRPVARRVEARRRLGPAHAPERGVRGRHRHGRCPGRHGESARRARLAAPARARARAVRELRRPGHPGVALPPPG